MENYQKVRPDNRLKLLDQVCDVIWKKHYSIRTEQAYVNWIQEITLCSFSKKSTGILNTQVQGYRFTPARRQRGGPARPDCIGTGGVQG